MKIWSNGELIKMARLKKLSLRPGYHCAREPGHRQVAGFDDPIIDLFGALPGIVPGYPRQGSLRSKAC
jgi:hypothetical protein